MRFRRNNRGFTLVEMVMSTVILSMASIALAGLLVHTLRGWSTGTAQVATAGATTIAMQKLATDIRDGRSAAVSTDNKTLTVTFLGTITDATTGETIYDPSGSVPATTRSYYIYNGNLVRSVGGNVTVIGKGVTLAEFHASYGLVNVVLKSAESISSKEVSLEINARVNLRNYRP